MAMDEAQTPAPPQPTALLVGSSPSAMAEVALALKELGVRAIELRPGIEPAAFVRDHRITLVVIDLDTRPDASGLLRRLRANGATAKVGVVVTCSRAAAAGGLKPLLPLGVGAVLVKPFVSGAVGQKLHQTLDRATRDAAAQNAEADDAADQGGSDAIIVRADRRGRMRRVEGNSSLLEGELLCPCHDVPVPVKRYTLRQGRVLTEADFFDITLYTAAAPRADYVNYQLLSVMVCPQCLFATNAPEQFRPAVQQKGRATVHPIRPPIVEALRDQAAARRELCGAEADDPSFFDHRRSLAGGIRSYELALASSRVLNARFKNEFPLESIRQANYHLRLARLKQLAGQAEDQTLDHYAAALPLLKESFTRIEGALLYRAVYQIVAVCIYLGDDQAASRYLDHLRSTFRESGQHAPDASTLERYLNRCTDVWPDRDRHRAPGVEVHPEAA